MSCRKSQRGRSCQTVGSPRRAHMALGHCLSDALCGHGRNVFLDTAIGQSGHYSKLLQDSACKTCNVHPERCSCETLLWDSLVTQSVWRTARKQGTENAPRRTGEDFPPKIHSTLSLHHLGQHDAVWGSGGAMQRHAAHQQGRSHCPSQGETRQQVAHFVFSTTIWWQPWLSEAPFSAESIRSKQIAWGAAVYVLWRCDDRMRSEVFHSKPVVSAPSCWIKKWESAVLTVLLWWSCRIRCGRCFHIGTCMIWLVPSCCTNVWCLVLDLRLVVLIVIVFLVVLRWVMCLFVFFCALKSSCSLF